jgi:excisionase family DNA binding protein
MINNSCVILARPNTGDYYEGDGNSLRAISPRPIVSPAQFLWDTSPQPVVFREDFYVRWTPTPGQNLPILKIICRLAAAKEIPAFKVGGTWRFSRADIDRWIAQQSSVDHGDGSPDSSKGGR